MKPNEGEKGKKGKHYNIRNQPVCIYKHWRDALDHRGVHVHSTIYHLLMLIVKVYLHFDDKIVAQVLNSTEKTKLMPAMSHFVHKQESKESIIMFYVSAYEPGLIRKA